MVNHFNVLNKLRRRPSDLALRPRLIFRKRMRHSNNLCTFFCAKMAKHKKYRVLLTFDDLSKNVKNAILTYSSTRFVGVDKKLLYNC